MELKEIMDQLSSLTNERTKKYVVGGGAKELVFGCTISSMKPLFKQLKFNQTLADQLYETGNYDAMYLAGMIAEPKKMTKQDFDRWIDKAYFFMISDFIVSVTLAEADIGAQVADEWIESDKELTVSAGWKTYEWMLGTRKNETFDEQRLKELIKIIPIRFESQPPRAQCSMVDFLQAVAISYPPLHEEALKVAKLIGKREIKLSESKSRVVDPLNDIVSEVSKGRLGFKRKHVRC
ncbi:MAG: DNA alkylation repair protein [Erysipelotrichaceae bacterium]|nr:DNA alkylation repair protein [Erysipelotrichaceae bacterium]